MFNNSETKYERNEDGELPERTSLLIQLSPSPLRRLKGQGKVVRRYLCCIYTCFHKLQLENNAVQPIKNNEKTVQPMNAHFPMEHAGSFQSK